MELCCVAPECPEAAHPIYPMCACLLAEEALDEMQIGSPKRDSRLGSEMLLRREGKVGYNGDRKDSKTHSSRKKKSKGSEEKSSSSAAELAQLFTTTLDGRNAISANDEIDNSGNVVKLEM